MGLPQPQGSFDFCNPATTIANTTMTSATSRRAFLQRASLLSMAGAASPWAPNLAALGEAAAATASDYKALEYALAPKLAPLLPLFTGQQMAVLLNVGKLVQPTTKAQCVAPLSHNDQESVWQSSAPEGAASGWGGRMGDLFAAGNGTATSTCVNVAGNAVFLSGRSAVQCQVSPPGRAQWCTPGLVDAAGSCAAGVSGGHGKAGGGRPGDHVHRVRLRAHLHPHRRLGPRMGWYAFDSGGCGQRRALLRHGAGDCQQRAG
jgi:uncharacterized protein (DUF1501 family)